MAKIWLPSFLRRESSGHQKKTDWFGWSLWGGAAGFNTYNEDIKKLQLVLRSPAVLKVFALVCDLYSLGNIYEYNGDKEIKKSQAVKLFDQPNPFQSQSQFKWTFMFWNMMGNVNLYIDKDVASTDNKLYFLVPHKIEWPQYFETNKDKLIFSYSSLKTLQEQQLTYRYEDGTSVSIPYKKVIQYFDLTNGIGNWFKGNSRLDALIKIIEISEAGLDAKKINVEFSGKFLVAGVKRQDDVSANARPLGKDDKRSSENVLDSDKPVHAIANMLDVHRFVSDMGALKLDEAFFASAFQIGNLYGIPKDVLELYLSSSTYENQEKAKGSVVSYCLEPKANDMLQPISARVLMGDRKFVMSWDHLPFMQYAEKDRADVNLKKSQTLLNLQKAGVSEEDINKFMDTSFTNLNPISDVKEPTQQEPTAGASNQSGTDTGASGQAETGTQGA